MRGPGRYELLEHTADTGVRVHGADLPGLFEQAAAAMFDVMADLSRVTPTLAPVRVFAGGEPGVDALLVAWLGELLSRAMAENRVYCSFDVSTLEKRDDGWALEAHVAGAPFEEHQEAFRTELKAVTWHGLSVRETEAGFVATVLFDQ